MVDNKKDPSLDIAESKREMAHTSTHEATLQDQTTVIW